MSKKHQSHTMISIARWQGTTILIRDIAISIVSLLLVAVIVRHGVVAGWISDFG
jgi:hypothetical protein